MSVLGQLKEMLQICLAILVFSDQVSLRAVFGLSVSACAAYYYRNLKAEEAAKKSNSVQYHLQCQKEEEEEPSHNLFFPKPRAQTVALISNNTVYKKADSRVDIDELDVFLCSNSDDDLELPQHSR
jgi:hypothetical protein